MEPSEYIECKNIKLQNSVIEEPFLSLQAWFVENYKIKPLSFLYEYMSHNQTPRLEIVFERINGNDLYFNDMSRLETVADFFSKLIKEKHQYKSDGLFIIHSYFEVEALKEATSKITENELNELKLELKSENIWTIKLAWAGAFPIVFSYTKEQVSQFSNLEFKNTFLDKYKKLLKKYDEFNYAEFDILMVEIDSKEYFDEVYKSKWVNYFHDH